MNKDVLEGKWKQLRGKVREQWGELTDEELDQIAGKRDQLIGKVQEKYAYTWDEAEEEVEEFLDELKVAKD